MFARLLFCFIVIPLIELTLLIKMGQIIGLWETIGIQIVSGFIGATLAKRQGSQVFRSINEALAEGRIPKEELMDGLLILAAGLVLLTPGLLTDALGLSLLFPPTRKFYKDRLRNKLKKMAEEHQSGFKFIFFR